MNEYIRYKHFKSFLTSPTYLIWNEINDDANHDDHDFLDEENDIFQQSFQNIVESFEGDEKIFSPLTFNLFKKVQKEIYNFFLNEYNSKYSKEEIFIVNAKQTNLAFQQTMDAINSKKYKLIVDPVFIYQDKILAKAGAYDVEKQKIIEYFFTNSVKRDSFLKAYYSFLIADKLVAIKNCSFVCFKYKEKMLIKKGDIAFIELFYGNLAKNKKTFPTKGDIEKTAKNKHWIYQLGKKLDSVRSDNFNDNQISIFKILSTDFFINYPNDSNKENEYWKNPDSLDAIITKIENAKNNNNPNYSVEEMDKTFWGPNSEAIELYKKHHHPQLVGISGKMLTKKKYLEFAKKWELNNHEPFPIKKEDLDFFNANEVQIDEDNITNYNIYKKLTKPNQRTIWYDFEGFSTPFASYDYVENYQQVVFQVSIIETYNDQIQKDKINNIVVDPQKLTPKDFANIIKSIYSNKANNYVVFNKTYENTRLKEMADLIRRAKNEQNDHIFKLEEVEEIDQMVEHIIKNTIDLADYFVYNKNFIRISFLKGFYSIKKIEKFITINDIKLKNRITPYKELEIQNGLMAMETAISRYLGDIGDHVWKNKIEKLKQYCQNDVMAMIMVWDFIKYILENKKSASKVEKLIYN